MTCRQEREQKVKKTKQKNDRQYVKLDGEKTRRRKQNISVKREKERETKEETENETTISMIYINALHELGRVYSTTVQLKREECLRYKFDGNRFKKTHCPQIYIYIFTSLFGAHYVQHIYYTILHALTA